MVPKYFTNILLFLIDYRLRAKEQSARIAMARAERAEAHFAVIEVQRERWLEEEKAELERAAYIRGRTARLAAGDGEAFVDRADLGVGNRTVEERVRAFYAFHPKFRDPSKNLVRCLLSLSCTPSLLFSRLARHRQCSVRNTHTRTHHMNPSNVSSSFAFCSSPPIACRTGFLPNGAGSATC